MEILLLIIGVILIALSLTILLISKKNAPSEDGKETLRELERFKEEQAKAQSELRREISEGVQRSVLTLGGVLRTQQEQSDKALKEQIHMMDRSMQEKQTALQDGINNQLRQNELRLKTLEENNEQKLDNIRRTVSDQLTVLREDNNKRLEAMQTVVDEKLQKTLEEKMNDSFKLVSERLEQVSRGLGEMQTIASGVGDLKKVLSNVKNRGILGEIRLGAILEDILTPEQYDTDVATVPKSTNRVEFAIKLPGAGEGEHVYLPIDSKFPGDTYAALQDAYDTGDTERVAEARKLLATVVKRCAKDIRDKYVEPPATTNFGIMFLPFEGLYAEVVNSGLVEILQRDYQINVAGPSTMAAMLNSLQMGFRTLAIQKRSNEVWTILGGVKSEFQKFETALDATQKHLRQVDEDLEKLVGVRTRQINRQLRNVETDESFALPEGTDEN